MIFGSWVRECEREGGAGWGKDIHSNIENFENATIQKTILHNAAAALKNTLILWPRTEVNRSNDGLMSSAFKLNVSPGKQQALLELSPFF